MHYSSILLLAGEISLRSLLPNGAFVVETRALPQSVHSHRLLVLWMLSPATSECPSTPSCFDVTRGCYLRGPTRLSLIDTASDRIVNTIPIACADCANDTFDLPRKLPAHSPYRVAN